MDVMLASLGLAGHEGGPVKPEQHIFNDDGAIPNTRLATLVFRSSGVDPGLDREGVASRFEQIFAASAWRPSWRGGVYDYHHYHSNAHEAFGVLSGRGQLRLGGAQGIDIELKVGDALVLPAGTGHCSRWASDDLLLLAAYPKDHLELDLIRADPQAHDAAVARIAQVSRPPCDPLGGDLTKWWT